MSLQKLHDTLKLQEERSNGTTLQQVIQLKKELEKTGLLLIDNLSGLSRHLKVLNDTSSSNKKITASLTAIKNIIHQKYVNEFIDVDGNFTEQGERNILQLPDASAAALETINPNNSRVKEVVKLIGNIKGDFPSENPRIRSLRRRSLKGLSPLVVNILLKGNQKSFNAFMLKYKKKYTALLIAKDNILEINKNKIQESHKEAEIRRRIQEIRSIGIFGKAEYKDLNDIKTEVLSSNMDSDQKNALLSIIYNFGPELNSGANRDQLLEKIEKSHFSPNDKDIIKDIILTTTPDTGSSVDISSISKEIITSQIEDKQDVNNFIISLKLSQNVVLQLRGLKKAIDLGLTQIESTQENKNKQITIILNEANWSQTTRRHFGNFVEKAFNGASTIAGEPSIRTSFNNATHEYSMTFNPTYDGKNVIGGRENALSMMKAFTVFLETQESFSINSGIDWAKELAFNVGVGVSENITVEAANSIFIDYPIFLGKEIALPILKANGIVDYAMGEIDEGELILRGIFLGILPIALLGPTLYDILQRADRGMEPAVMDDIVKTLKELKLLHRSNGNKGGEKKIIDFLDELSKNFPEFDGDNIVGMKDPFRTKKVFYRLLNKHFSEYQGAFKGVPGIIGDYVDQPLFQRKDENGPKTNKKGVEYGFIRKNLWRVLRFYSIILLGPTKFINRGPSKAFIEFGQKGDSIVTRLKKFKIIGGGVFLKDSSIIMHGEAKKAELMRAAFINEKLSLISQSSAKEGVQKEIAKIQEGMLWFNHHAPYTRRTMMGNVNTLIAEALSRAIPNSNAINIKGGLDRIDSSFVSTADVMKEIVDTRLPTYLDFIKGHSGINDNLEKQLLQSLSELRYTSTSVSDFEVKMAGLFSQVDEISGGRSLGFTEIERIKKEEIGILFDNVKKAETLSGYKNFLLKNGVTPTTVQEYAGLLDNFIGENRDISQKHICYAMSIISNGIAITPDQLIAPKAIHSFLTTHGISVETKAFLEDKLSYNLSQRQVPLQTTTNNSMSINTGTNQGSLNSVGRDRISDHILGVKTFRKMREGEIIPPKMWKHSIFRNSQTTKWGKLTPQEQALDILIRHKISYSISYTGGRSDQGFTNAINKINDKIRSVKLQDTIIINQEIAGGQNNNSTLSDWEAITNDIGELDDVKKNALMKDFSNTNPQIQEKFRDLFDAPNGVYKYKNIDVDTVIKYMFKAL